EAGRLHPPPNGVEELEEGPDRVRESGVVAELVGLLRVPGEVEGPQEPRHVRPIEPRDSRLEEPREGHDHAGPFLAVLRLTEARELGLELRDTLVASVAHGAALREGHDLRTPTGGHASTSLGSIPEPACGYR